MIGKNFYHTVIFKKHEMHLFGCKCKKGNLHFEMKQNHCV